MSNILCPTDGLVPALREVEDAGFEAQAQAVVVGSIELLVKKTEALINSLELDGRDLSLGEFEAFVSCAILYIPDPVMVLVSDQVVSFDTYEYGVKWFEEMCNQPETLSEEMRNAVLNSLYTHLDELSDKLNQDFNKTFSEEEYLVHVTDNGRIVVARYDDELPQTEEVA
jgi:hypothetical protein